MSTPISATSPSRTASIQTKPSGAKHSNTYAILTLQRLGEAIKSWKKDAQQFREKAFKDFENSSVLNQKADECDEKRKQAISKYNEILTTNPTVKIDKIVIKE